MNVVQGIIFMPFAKAIFLSLSERSASFCLAGWLVVVAVVIVVVVGGGVIGWLAGW